MDLLARPSSLLQFPDDMVKEPRAGLVTLRPAAAADSAVADVLKELVRQGRFVELGVAGGGADGGDDVIALAPVNPS